MFKVNSKGTRMTSMTLFWCTYYQLLTYFTPCSSVSTVDFQQINAAQERSFRAFEAATESCSGKQMFWKFVLLKTEFFQDIFQRFCLYFQNTFCIEHVPVSDFFVFIQCCFIIIEMHYDAISNFFYSAALFYIFCFSNNELCKSF